MQEKKKIVYVGMDIETFFLLSDESFFQVLGVSKIENFEIKTFNPANFIFKWLYYLRCANKLIFLELFVLLCWIIFSPLSSSVFKKYAQYLKFISWKRIKVLNFGSHEISENLKLIKVDLIVVNNWGVLSEEVILSPVLGTVNIHPSMLPKYRGALPTLWSLKNEDKKSAVTYLLLDKNVDAGKIISQHVFNLESNENWLSMEKKVAEIIKKTLISDLKKYIAGEIKPFPQDERMKSITENYLKYLKIDWENEKAEDAYNKINLYPFLDPGLYCYFYLGKNKIEIKRAELLEYMPNLRVDQFSLRGARILFQTKCGIIQSRLFLDLNFLNSVIFLRSYLKFKI